MRSLQTFAVVSAFSLTCLADPSSTSVLQPMPNATNVKHRVDPEDRFEELRFEIQVECPEDGEAIRFYRRVLNDAGYRLATAPTAKWVYLSDFERGENAYVYKAVFCNNVRRNILFIETQCPVAQAGARGSAERVWVVIQRDRPYDALQQMYNVNCSEN